MRKRKRRERRRTRIHRFVGATVTTVLGLALAVAISYQTSNGQAGDKQGARSRKSPGVAAGVPVPRLPTFSAPVPDGISPEPGATGSGTASEPVAEEAPTPSPPAAPDAPLGQAGLNMLSDRSWVFDYVVRQEQERQHRRMVWRIDTWLSQAGSPMAGTGECFIANSERTGVPAALPVGIAWAESSAGMRCYRNPPGGCSFNAYGMIGPEYRDGFSCWEEGITANFDYLVKHFGCPQSMYQCPGYCVGDTTMRTVDDVQRYIEGIDASWIQ